MKRTKQKSQSELKLMQHTVYKWANLDMSIKSAGALGAVRDPVGRLVYGGEARRRGRCALCATLHA